jgi:hypothetical protein
MNPTIAIDLFNVLPALDTGAASREFMAMVRWSDQILRLMSPGRLWAARALVRISATQLVQRAMLGIATVRRAEAFDGPIRVTSANYDAIVEFLRVRALSSSTRMAAGRAYACENPNVGEGTSSMGVCAARTEEIHR